jgi:putative ABC transport system ATP-binding protein
MLEVRNLQKSYTTPQGKARILDGVSLDLPSGNSLALMGESGSGKSTLLHLIGGLDTPDGGQILLDGTDIGALSDAGRADLRRGQLGVVFQQFNLIPSLTVRGNLAFQARISDRFDPAWQAHLAQTLGLEDLLQRYPEQLSGGQQQRVAIGRTLAARPQLMLADEPTGNLDETTGDAVLDLTLSLVRDLGNSLLMVTHNPRLAERLDHTVTLSGGRIIL